MKDVIHRVNPEFVHEKMQRQSPIHVIDVRSVNEYSTEHVQGAKLLPMDDLSVNTVRSKFGNQAGEDEPIYLVCSAGFRAQQAAEKLQAEGLKNMFVVNGGTDAWAKLDLPTVKLIDKKRSIKLSPQAQAQVFMGVVILLFVAKGMLLHPIFTMLIGVVGLLMLISAFD